MESAAMQKDRLLDLGGNKRHDRYDLYPYGLPRLFPPNSAGFWLLNI